MMLFPSTFLYTCLFYLVESSHFRGGIISWKPTENNQIELNYRVAFRASSGHTCDANTIRNGTLLSGEGSLQCVEGCSDTITTMSYYCTDFSATEDWTSGTNSVKYNLSASSNNLFTFGFSSCCWIPLVEGGSDWRMRTTANLTVRQDTGKINSSPISAMQPVVRFSYGCDYTLKIPVSDDDGDVVKCRWSKLTPTDECGGVCETLSGSYLDESSCVLSYNATRSMGWYAVALQIEDFQKSADRAPLSSVSLQFLIVVTNSSASCESRPVLPPNIITDGSIHHISDYKIFNESIIARSGAATLRITAIDTVSPIGMIKSEIFPYGTSGREWFVTVTWEPMKTQIGTHLFCYTAVDNLGQTSDQTCATLVVDGEVADDVSTDTPEPDNLIVLNPECNAFKTPQKVHTKCIEATTGDPKLFYLATSCSSNFVQCTELGTGYIMRCAPGTEWCQHFLTCVHVGSCKTEG